MNNEISSLRVKSAVPSPKRIVCLWLPHWPIQRLIAAQRELNRQRIVLFRRDSRRGQLVAAASPLAQRDGVRIGMPLSESKSLLARGVRKNPPAHDADGSRFHILPHDPAADLLAIQKLADDLDEFSPIVGLQQETDRPDCIFLDITGLAHLFGGESRLAEGVENFCRERGCLPRLAIADTLGMAQAIAQHSPECHPHRENLPVAALRLADGTIDALRQLGIVNIGQLLRLPRRDLTARFGDELNRRIDQFTGALAEPIVARRPPPEFHAAQLLDYPTGHRETIEVIIGRLIEGICGKLGSAQQGALQWTIRLYCGKKLPLKLCVGLFQPTATAGHVIPLANMQLDQLLQPRANQYRGRRTSTRRFKTLATIQLDGQPLEVSEITVTVTSCVLMAHRQRELFDENPRRDPQALAHLINRLSSRLGRQNVVFPTIVFGAQPEQAFEYRPLVDPCRRGPRRSVAKAVAPPGAPIMARPLTLFEAAIALDDGSLPPRFPVQFMHAHDRHTIINHWGPERIETGWWRGRTVRRDYWRVETETHQQFWIYFDLQQRAWFLHGEF